MVAFGSPQVLLSFLLWAALVVYGFSSLWWLLETFVLSRGWKPHNTEAWGLGDIQVRILTIDNQQVVQQTVSGIPDAVTDVRVIGVDAYRKHPILWPIFVLLTPVAVVLHAVGALWGVIRPVEEFEVTEKVTAETIEDVNQSLEEGALQEHDGTSRLLRESSDDFETNLFDE